jgi:flagellar capping protein FliD
MPNTLSFKALISLCNAIQLVQYNLDELDRTVSKKFDNVEADIQDLTDTFNRERRRTKNERSDMKQTMTAMQSEIKALNDKVFGIPEEEKKKD